LSITPIDWPGSTRLWRVDLDAAPVAAACLSEAELARAQRFAFERDRRRYVAAHVALRQLLAAASGIDPAALAFSAAAFGKPALVGPAAGLHFNLSHSQSQALVAIDARCPVGIDIELVRDLPDAQQLAATCFTPDELEALQRQPATARERAFLVGWTRKEACLKALGLGLSAEPRTLEVGLEPADGSAEYLLDGYIHTLNVSAIPLGSEALGALAVETSRRLGPPVTAGQATLASLP
jgi:4'-phosphopantetheinyl transferase